MTESGFKAVALAREEEELTLEMLASCVRVHPEWIRHLVDFGLLTPTRIRGRHMLFEAATVMRLRRILRLQRHLGVNLAGVAIILELHDRLSSLQRELEELRLRLG